MTGLHQFPIQARWFLLLWFVPQFYDPSQLLVDLYLADKFFPESLYSDESYLIPEYFFNFSYRFYNATRILLVLAFCFLITGTSVRPFLRPFESRLLVPGIEVTAFTYFASGALVYLCFFPLSFLTPNFVQFWLIELPDIIHRVNGELKFWPNFLSLVSLSVLAPITEEFIFRGVLLQRWGSKYNSEIAILLSSAVFASLHTDPFGAFIFALLMCLLTVRSGSLILPILCHSLYNGSIWILELLFEIATPEAPRYSMADFHNEWPWAILFCTISACWALRLKGLLPALSNWKIPVLYTQNK